jgi:hypothetical protein
MLMTWVNSAGSSASSSWLELRMYSPEEAALYCDETVKKEYSFATQDGRSKKELVHDTKIITDALSKAISESMVLMMRCVMPGYSQTVMVAYLHLMQVRKIMTLYSANPSLIG